MYITILLAVFFTSCDKIYDEVLPVVGVYEGHVAGISGPFSMNISADGRDNILIDAPFDGETWMVVRADINETDGERLDIHIPNQEVLQNVKISGSGFFYRGTVQLDYSLKFDGDKNDFRIIGSKF